LLKNLQVAAFNLQ